ncbi:MAG: hypothetical protein WCH39_25770 [Schlesneria sp.]
MAETRSGFSSPQEKEHPKLALFSHGITEREAEILRLLSLKPCDGLQIYYSLRGTPHEVAIGSLCVALRRMQDAGLIDGRSDSLNETKGEKDQTQFSVTPKGTRSLELFNEAALMSTEQWSQEGVPNVVRSQM